MSERNRDGDKVGIGVGVGVGLEVQNHLWPGGYLPINTFGVNKEIDINFTSFYCDSSFLWVLQYTFAPEASSVPRLGLPIQRGPFEHPGKRRFNN